MNNTYKVVFNKARGVLMVANEITSSVQKKGTKTVVAAAVATALSVAASASVAETWDIQNKTGSTALIGNLSTEIVQDGAVVANNKIEMDDKRTWLLGSVFSPRKTTTTISNSRFENNETVKSVNNPDHTGTGNLATEENGVLGGVAFVKGGKTTFTDTVFKNNTITSKVQGKDGALVAGGALYQDAVINSTDVEVG